MQNVILTLMITIVCAGASGCAGPRGEQGFVSLFNGKDLTGWITPGQDNSWVVENSVLTVKRDVMDGKEHNFDYLWT